MSAPKPSLPSRLWRRLTRLFTAPPWRGNDLAALDARQRRDLGLAPRAAPPDRAALLDLTLPGRRQR